MIYLQLFLSFLQIGAFSFGGGYAAMPLIQEQVITLHNWLTFDTFANLVTIAEMTPGPIAVNAGNLCWHSGCRSSWCHCCYYWMHPAFLYICNLTCFHLRKI